MTNTKLPGTDHPEAPSAPPPASTRAEDGLFAEAEAEAETKATAPLGTGHRQVRALVFSLAVLVGAALVAAGFATSVRAVQWLGIALIVVPGGFGLANHIWYGPERVDPPR
jgi:hypothetical protein